MRILLGLLIGTMLLESSEVAAEPACLELVRCTMSKCIRNLPQPYPVKENLIEYILRQASFACVFGAACHEPCRKCPHCKYTQDQIKHFVLGQQTDGLCPNLESCAQRCVKEELTKDPFGCVFKRNCARYCFDESECSPCYNTIKRVFTGVCKTYSLNETYNEKCRPLYDETTRLFVANAKNVF